jgi:hypothetical protein
MLRLCQANKNIKIEKALTSSARINFSAQRKVSNLLIYSTIFHIFAHPYSHSCLPAQMAELVDALVSETSVGNNVQVRVLFWAQIIGDPRKNLILRGSFVRLRVSISS